MSSILLGIHDPFLPFENLICTLCFGGIWDKLAKLLGYGQAKEETKDTKKSNWANTSIESHINFGLKLNLIIF